MREIFCLGYGFNANTVSLKAIKEFVEKYDKSLYDEIRTEQDWENISSAELNSYLDCLAEYIGGLINEKERAGGNTEGNVVNSFGNYIVFHLPFSDEDRKNPMRAKTEDEFIEMLSRYLDTSMVDFGDVFSSEEPCSDIWMEA